MKPVKVDEGKHKKKDRNRRRVVDEFVDDSAEESTDEDVGDDEEQEYLFFDIESRQDQDKYIANLLIVQD